MGKQVQLQAAIKKLDGDLKSTKLIELTKVAVDKINIGCTVKLENIQTNESLFYSILGPWDANTEKNIISYQSPLGKAQVKSRFPTE